VHFGDSTSDGLVSAGYLPHRGQRIGAQYARVGATAQRFEIQGATSIVETIRGEPNTYDVARQLVRGGYHGCWVLALGTNDTADVAVGSAVGPAERIRRMMSAAAGQPVLWVNVKSLLSSGPYAETRMRSWNSALVRACASYPNMRVFDWASVAQPRWFTSDGIHYTSAGYAERSRLIASALAQAFPQDSTGSGSGCVISAGAGQAGASQAGASQAGASQAGASQAGGSPAAVSR
jgi:GDSL-like Lipase/Acylhydrolase family